MTWTPPHIHRAAENASDIPTPMNPTTSIRDLLRLPKRKGETGNGDGHTEDRVVNIQAGSGGSVA